MWNLAAVLVGWRTFAFDDGKAAKLAQVSYVGDERPSVSKSGHWKVNMYDMEYLEYRISQATNEYPLE